MNDASHAAMLGFNPPLNGYSGLVMVIAETLCCLRDGFVIQGQLSAQG